MIVFDFDGVLVDSIDEIALTVYNLVYGTRYTNLDNLPDGYLELFKRNKHIALVPNRTISLAYWVLEKIESGDKLDLYISSKEFASKHLLSNPKFSRDDFFAARQWLIDNYTEKWLALNRPFSKIWEALQKLDPNNYFILTYKNRASVIKLCSHYGLNIKEDRLFTGELGKSKKENILEIDKITKAQTDYIFLDDAFENLEALYQTLPGRITPIMAAWGYNGPEDRLSAQNHGFELTSEEGFISKYLTE